LKSWLQDTAFSFHRHNFKDRENAVEADIEGEIERFELTWWHSSESWDDGRDRLMAKHRAIWAAMEIEAVMIGL
jgi:hypothetical protein